MHALSSKDLTALEHEIGHRFNEKSLLKKAVTHKSHAHENQTHSLSFNERLEFLGDSVLELIVSEYLYSNYKDFTEADLSRVKSYAVQEATLAETARRLNLGSYLLLGKGEEVTGGREKPSLLADAFEAVLAAIYLDGGYDKAQDFTLKYLGQKIDDFAQQNFIVDFKTKLQEVSQSQFGVLPNYITHKEEGPEHQKSFEVEVYVKEKLFGSGRGRTKKAAAQKAAEEGLQNIKENNEDNL
jgi:ribonuclease-3